MNSTPIKSFNKYILSCKDSANIKHQIGIYARDAYDFLIIATEFNSYFLDHPNTELSILQKF